MNDSIAVAAAQGEASQAEHETEDDEKGVPAARFLALPIEGEDSFVNADASIQKLACLERVSGRVLRGSRHRRAKSVHVQGAPYHEEESEFFFPLGFRFFLSFVVFISI